MGQIHVHEFVSLDGNMDAPTWTFEYGFDPKMGEAIGAVTERCKGILLGRETYQMFEPAWSTRTAEDDPGAPFFNDTTKYVVSGTLTEGNVAQLGDHRRLRRRPDPPAQGRGRRRPLHQRQRPARPRAARRRPDRRPAPVRLPAHARPRPARVRRGRCRSSSRSKAARPTTTASSTCTTVQCRELRDLRTAQGRERRPGGARARCAGGRGRGLRVDLGRRSHRAAARTRRTTRTTRGWRRWSRSPISPP